jgi:hypothetical protein
MWKALQIFERINIHTNLATAVLSISHKDFSTLSLWCSQVLNPIAYESDQLLPMNFRTCILLAILLTCQNFSSSSTMPLQAIWLTRSTITLSYSLGQSSTKIRCVQAPRAKRWEGKWDSRGKLGLPEPFYFKWQCKKKIEDATYWGKNDLIYLNVNKVLRIELWGYI